MVSDSGQTKDELMNKIESGWKELNAVVNQLTVTQATEIKDAQGWSAKDHLFHLMAWENSAIFFLTGQPRYEGLGIGEQLFMSGSGDEINAAILKLGKASGLYEVRVQYQIVHNRLVQQLTLLDDSELEQPYQHFLTDATGDMRTASQVVLSNTADHYSEHMDWIKAMLG